MHHVGHMSHRPHLIFSIIMRTIAPIKKNNSEKNWNGHVYIRPKTLIFGVSQNHHFTSIAMVIMWLL